MENAKSYCYIISHISFGRFGLYFRADQNYQLHFIVYVIVLLWAMAKHEGLQKNYKKDSGLTSEEFSTMLEEKTKR